MATWLRQTVVWTLQKFFTFNEVLNDKIVSVWSRPFCLESIQLGWSTVGSGSRSPGAS